MGDNSVGLSSYTKTFEEVFPWYLSIGMSYEQFWMEDPRLVIAYRKAHDLKNQEANQKLWLQGLYMCYANNATIGNMFNKKGAKKMEYPKEPIPLTLAEIEAKKLAEHQKKIEQMKMKMIARAMAINKHRQKEEEKV